MRAFRSAIVFVILLPAAFAMQKGPFWAISEPAPKVVRTPISKIKPLPNDLEPLWIRSNQLAPTDIARLKARIVKTPGDASARAMLMAYSMFQRSDKGLQRLHREQIVWFVANTPDSIALRGSYMHLDHVSDARTYALVEDLYGQALAKRPRNVSIIKNYASLTLVNDTPHTLRLLENAVRIAPKDGELYERLAFAHVLASHRYKAKNDPVEASLAVDNYEKAQALGRRISDKFFLEATFDANRLDVAERRARASVTKVTDADAIHTGHTTLGRIALKRGDVEGAKRHLLDSAKVEGSPVLGSFGPEMTLAKELLAKGERSTVLEYLKSIGRFWNDERQKRWAKAVEDGGTPDWDDA